MSSARNDPRGPRLRIVAVNDVYTLEHLPRLKGLVSRMQREDPADHLLVTLAGDFVSPSMLSSLDFGRGMIDCMNDVGFTHVTFGNHEDDVPIDELVHRESELNATWLATNVRGLPKALPTSDVVTVEAAGGGRAVRVGLIGVVMNDPAVYRRPPFGAAEVSSPRDAALAEASRLVRDERCVAVIPLTHQSADDDRDLARAAKNPPFPVLVAGHEHVVIVEKIESTWIVKAGSDALHAAVIDLEWPREAPSEALADALPDVTVRLEDVLNEAEDAALRAKVDTHMRRVAELEAATLMKIPAGEVLSSVGTRKRQTSLGTLLCSLVRDALDAEACLFNGGGIRAAREYQHHFTYGDLKAEVPFDNEVVVADLPGSVVREAIEASRSHESGGFLQVDDGIRIDAQGSVTHLDGAPLDEARSYRVALVRNLFQGLDHIAPLERFAREHPADIPPEASGREIKMVLVEAFALALWKQLGGFDAIDENMDGVVTASEIGRAVARFTEDAPSPLAADLVLRTIDVNHDHTITRDEAELAAHRNEKKKRSDP